MAIACSSQARTPMKAKRRRRTGAGLRPRSRRPAAAARHSSSPRRMEEALPGLRTDGVAEQRVVVAPLQPIAPGVLPVGPAGRQIRDARRSRHRRSRRRAASAPPRRSRARATRRAAAGACRGQSPLGHRPTASRRHRFRPGRIRARTLSSSRSAPARGSTAAPPAPGSGMIGRGAAGAITIRGRRGARTHPPPNGGGNHRPPPSPAAAPEVICRRHQVIQAPG